jgi:hypothetical protein
MATPTALDLFEHYDETNQLSRVDHFIALEQEKPREARGDDKPRSARERYDTRLEDFEFAKLDDVRDDIVWLQERDRRSLADRAPWLGSEYARFEQWWGRPGNPLRGLASAPQPAPSAPPPGPFDAEYLLFDRLSLWYGGNYRGVIIFNLRNALLGGLAALAAHTVARGSEIVLGTGEILLFLVMLVFYVVGRTPAPAFRGTSRERPAIARRWHQRWLEYRVLAERFRYAALLAPVAREPMAHTWRRLLGDQTTATTWHDRFFLWRLGIAPEPVLPDDVWFDRLLKIMRYQQWYHDQASGRRHNAVQRLEWTSLGALIAALVFLTVRVLMVVYLELHYGEQSTDPAARWLVHAAAAASFAGGWCTLLAASVHAMLSTAELKRLAESSRETTRRIEGLYRVIDERHKSGANPTAVREEVEAFCALVTEEASGWRALLRDKDVPVPHAG